MTNRKGKVRTRPGSVNAAMTPLRPGRDPSGGTGNGTATTSCPHETQEQARSYMKPCGLRRVSDLLLLTRPTAPQPPAPCARARRAAVRTASERKAQLEPAAVHGRRPPPSRSRSAPAGGTCCASVFSGVSRRPVLPRVSTRSLPDSWKSSSDKFWTQT